jgi:predicted nucleic acid-binding protein
MSMIVQDADDNKFADCAFASNAHYLVSNDKHFNVLKKMPFPKIKVINMAEFISILQNMVDDFTPAR